jgi:hypothetical protein
LYEDIENYTKIPEEISGQPFSNGMHTGMEAVKYRMKKGVTQPTKTKKGGGPESSIIGPAARRVGISFILLF